MYLKTMEELFLYQAFTFTFTLHSSISIDMLTEQHHNMNLSPNSNSQQIYRKRPKPVRVVSFSSLNKTTASRPKTTSRYLVNSCRGNSIDGTWQPMPRSAIEVNVSPSSWSGLHSRVLASRKIAVEAI